MRGTLKMALPLMVSVAVGWETRRRSALPAAAVAALGRAQGHFGPLRRRTSDKRALLNSRSCRSCCHTYQTDGSPKLTRRRNCS
jgi:hypothetical protein